MFAAGCRVFVVFLLVASSLAQAACAGPARKAEAPPRPRPRLEPPEARTDAPWECLNCAYPTYDGETECPRCGADLREELEAAPPESDEDMIFLKYGAGRSDTTPVGVWYKTLGFTGGRRTVHRFRLDPETEETLEEGVKQGAAEPRGVSYSASTGLNDWLDGRITFPVDRTTSRIVDPATNQATDIDEWKLGDMLVGANTQFLLVEPLWGGVDLDMTLPTSSNTVSSREEPAFSLSTGLNLAAGAYYGYGSLGVERDLQYKTTSTFASLGFGRELGEASSVSISVNYFEKDLSGGISVSRVIFEDYLLGFGLDFDLGAVGEIGGRWAGFGVELSW